MGNGDVGNGDVGNGDVGNGHVGGHVTKRVPVGLLIIHFVI